MATPIQQAAAWYASKGLAPVRLAGPLDTGVRSPGKQPLDMGWQSGPCPTAEAAHARFEGHGGNIGIRMGGATPQTPGLVCLDVDGPQGAHELGRLAVQLGALPPTLTSRSGRVDGGVHFIFRLPLGVVLGNAKPVLDGRKTGKLDVRGEGGQIVVAPSVHPNGQPYQWLNTCDPAELPHAWVEHLVTPPDVAASAVADSGELDATIPEGQRRDKLFRLACSAHSIGADVAKIVHAANERCRPPLPTGEVAHLISDVIRRYPPGHGLSDVGNAERFHEQHSHALRHCADLGGWLAYDGRRWRGNAHAATRAAIDTVRSLYVDAAKCTDEEAAKAIRNHARACEAAGRVNSCRSLAEAKCDTPAEVFDSNPWIFVCGNATIDLRTMTVRPHLASDMVTQAADDTYFDPKASAPQWERFLARCWPDPDVREFLQRWCGLLLTGDCSEQKWMLLTGEGNNGKGVLVHTLSKMLGSYGYAAPNTFLTKRRNEPHPTELMAIRGRRAIFQSETEKGATWNEERLKQLTGRDAITARLIAENFVTFEPTGKIMVCANDAPTVEGDNHAFWRRILTVPCEVIIPAAEIDLRLEEKLAVELSGILNWSLTGLASYYQGGLRPPAAVVKAAAEYRESEDPLVTFIAECCDQGGATESSALYQGYAGYARRSGVEPISINAFGRAMQRRGYTPGVAGADRKRVRCGITLRDSLSL